MPKVTVPNIYITKLKELGVYDQWLANVKIQYHNCDYCWLNPESSRYEEGIKSLYALLNRSLSWEHTLEGITYWNEVSLRAEKLYDNN